MANSNQATVLGWDVGTKDYSCWVLRDGTAIIGTWDHEPTQDEIDIAIKGKSDG